MTIAASDGADGAPRRTMFFGWLVGVAALAGHALGRPLPAIAANGNAVKVGQVNSGTSPTTINTPGATAIRGIGSGQDRSGIFGQSSGNGSRGVTGFAAIGVLGFTNGPGGFGVMGNATSTTGTPRGVFGKAAAANGFAVFAKNFATSGPAVGVQGETESASGTGVVGRVRAASVTDGSSAGVSGHGGNMGVFGAGTEFGVFGVTQTSGGAAIGASSLVPDSVAIRADGPVQFSSSGIATISTGTKQTTVNPDVPVDAESKILCTLLNDPGSSRLLYAQPGTDAFTIHMTQNVSGNVKVAWFVID